MTSKIRLSASGLPRYEKARVARDINVPAIHHRTGRTWPRQLRLPRNILCLTPLQRQFHLPRIALPVRAPERTPVLALTITSRKLNQQQHQQLQQTATENSPTLSACHLTHPPPSLRQIRPRHIIAHTNPRLQVNCPPGLFPATLLSHRRTYPITSVPLFRAECRKRRRGRSPGRVFPAGLGYNPAS
jgi:hypothetical protein